jgi:AcrR family transcriptional regulator
VRENGQDTSSRLLKAACELFAEKGYHAVTVAEICRRARANVAAVNYYFHSKANLYIEAWKHAYKKYPWPELSDSHASPEERFRAYVRYLMKKFTAQGPQGQFARLYLMELLNPTGLIQDVWHEMVKPRREVLLKIIRDIMGKEVTDEKVLFCELSIINQCRVLLTIRQCDLEYLLGKPLSPELLERLADHIAEFSLMGIRTSI